MPPLARSNYATALRSTGITLALIETAEGGSIGRASMLLAVAGDEKPVSALFATFRSFLVRFSCLGCLGCLGELSRCLLNLARQASKNKTYAAKLLRATA
jgi:hypothetical protein